MALVLTYPIIKPFARPFVALKSLNRAYLYFFLSCFFLGILPWRLASLRFRHTLDVYTLILKMAKASWRTADVAADFTWVWRIRCQFAHVVIIYVLPFLDWEAVIPKAFQLYIICCTVEMYTPNRFDNFL